LYFKYFQKVFCTTLVTAEMLRANIDWKSPFLQGIGLFHMKFLFWWKGIPHGGARGGRRGGGGGGCEVVR